VWLEIDLKRSRSNLDGANEDSTTKIDPEKNFSKNGKKLEQPARTTSSYSDTSISKIIFAPVHACREGSEVMRKFLYALESQTFEIYATKAGNRFE